MFHNIVTYMVIHLLCLANSLNEYVSDNDTFWQSISDFVPVNNGPTGVSYGVLTLRDSLYMKFDIILHAYQDSNGNVFRIGYDSIDDDEFNPSCDAFYSNYPSFAENDGNTNRFFLSQQTRCFKQYSAIKLSQGVKYTFVINYNDDRVTILYKNESVSDYMIYVDAARTGTDPNFFNTTVKIWIPTDYPSAGFPVVAANATLSNISIVSYWSDDPISTTMAMDTTEMAMDTTEMVGMTTMDGTDSVTDGATTEADGVYTVTLHYSVIVGFIATLISM